MTDTNNLKELDRFDMRYPHEGPPSMIHKSDGPYADFAQCKKIIDGLISNLEEARNGMEYQPIMRLKIELERLKAENDLLRAGMKGDYDLDAWLEWAQEKAEVNAKIDADLLECSASIMTQQRMEIDRLKAKSEALRSTLKQVRSYTTSAILADEIDAALEGSGR